MVPVPELLYVIQPFLGCPPQSPPEATAMQRFAFYVLGALLLGLLPLLIAALGGALALLKSVALPSPSPSQPDPSSSQQAG